MVKNRKDEKIKTDFEGYVENFVEKRAIPILQIETMVTSFSIVAIGIMLTIWKESIKTILPMFSKIFLFYLLCFAPMIIVMLPPLPFTRGYKMKMALIGLNLGFFIVILINLFSFFYSAATFIQTCPSP